MTPIQLVASLLAVIVVLYGATLIVGVIYSREIDNQHTRQAFQEDRHALATDLGPYAAPAIIRTSSLKPRIALTPSSLVPDAFGWHRAWVCHGLGCRALGVTPEDAFYAWALRKYAVSKEDES